MTRNYGIDLLRLVLMFMVCILHTLLQGGIINACEFGTPEHYIYLFLEILCYCAVDGFALISGYTASDKPQNYSKIVDMWFQVFFYSFVITLLAYIVSPSDNLLFLLIECAFPVTNCAFWYFTAYFALFFVRPALNKFIFSIDTETAKKALIIIIALFSVMSTFADPFNLNSGYSALWLFILYTVGALAKRVGLFESQKSPALIMWWIGCIAFTWLIQFIIGSRNLIISYLSPTILFSGLFMVVLFSRFRPNGKVISKLSPLAFGIYLFHLNKVIWVRIIKDAFAFVASMNIIIGVICVFGIAAVIFLSGMIVEIIRTLFARLLRIHLLSEKIVGVVQQFISRIAAAIK